MTLISPPGAISDERPIPLREKLAFETAMHDHLENLSKQDATAELLYLQQHNTVKEAEGRLRETPLKG
jgi:hypothetical protein